jgi:hypothetical protein
LALRLTMKNFLLLKVIRLTIWHLKIGRNKKGL